MDSATLLPRKFSDQRAFAPFRSAGLAILVAGRLFYMLPHDVRRSGVALLKPSDFRRLQDLRASEVPAYDEHRCIFIHVPKAAGISVAAGLFGTPGGGHTHIGLYQLIFTRSEFDSYFKFTFVRNPWDRLFSAYEFLRHGGLNDVDRAWASENLSNFDSFEEFVRGWVNEESILSEVHFVPQYRFVCAPLRRRILVDFVGRYERLERDFEAIRARLRLPDVTIPHINQTSSKSHIDYREAYTRTTRRIVERVYRTDIELFEYSFEEAR